jgi:hypothetical protein
MHAETMQLVALLAVALVRDTEGELDPDAIAREAFDIAEALDREFHRRTGGFPYPQN